MVSLLAAAVFFVGLHLLVSGTRLRNVIVDRTGEPLFQGLFSLLALFGIVWLSVAYSRADYVELWGQLHSLRWPAIGVMLIAFLFVGVGITTPSPTATGGEAKLDEDEGPRGIVRVTRHPFLWGIAIWALGHLIMNGDLAALILFASLLGLAVAGPASIDAKRARKFGEKWDRFTAVTSNVPFAAIAQGRNSLELAELGWWRIAVALVLFASVLAFHAKLFGASALPV